MFQIKAHITAGSKLLVAKFKSYPFMIVIVKFQGSTIIHLSVYLYTKVKCVCIPSDSSNLEASIPCIKVNKLWATKGWKDSLTSMLQFSKKVLRLQIETYFAKILTCQVEGILNSKRSGGTLISLYNFNKSCTCTIWSTKNNSPY